MSCSNPTRGSSFFVFKSHPRQLIFRVQIPPEAAHFSCSNSTRGSSFFFEKNDCLGCAVLHCFLFVCLTLLAYFFLPSFFLPSFLLPSSLINMYVFSMCMCMCTRTCVQDPELDVEAQFSRHVVSRQRRVIANKMRLQCVSGWLWCESDMHDPLYTIHVHVRWRLSCS